jgi:hypothetical protein
MQTDERSVGEFSRPQQTRSPERLIVCRPAGIENSVIGLKISVAVDPPADLCAGPVTNESGLAVSGRWLPVSQCWAPAHGRSTPASSGGNVFDSGIPAGGKVGARTPLDSHTHLIRGGLNYNLELRWDGVPSLADGLRMLREQARRTLVKDSKKYASTGGWGFQVWAAGDPSKPQIPDSTHAIAACFTCHTPQKAQDYTFSTYIP